MEDNPLAQLYINRDEIVEIDFNKPYTNLKRKTVILPFNQIGGLLPYDSSNFDNTTARDFNKDIAFINSIPEGQEAFYRGLQAKCKKEIKYLNRQNRKDHIKGIESTLNFKAGPTQYTDTHDFTKEKKDETNNPDYLHHYKRSFMKTYEESKLKHLIILRK